MIRARRATADDCKQVFEWRNDAQTRAMSLSTDGIDWRRHQAWFAELLCDGSRLLVICEESVSHHRIAAVRFDFDDDRARVSINIAPERRGQGLAKGCLTSAMEFMSSLFGDVTAVDAQVRLENSASRRCFEGLGFSLVADCDGVLQYRQAI